MERIHISEADAARDFSGLLARARAGAEIVIESEAYPAAVLRVAEPPRSEGSFAACCQWPV